MRQKMRRPVMSLLVMIVLAVSGLTGCASPATPTPTAAPPAPGGPGGPGRAVVNSDSIVTVKIQAIRKQASGYPWELDVLVQSSADVGSLPNPTKDSVGKVITVKTDQDMTSFKANDAVTAKVKYVGDVPKPGITLYLYNVAPLISPKIAWIAQQSSVYTWQGL